MGRAARRAGGCELDQTGGRRRERPTRQSGKVDRVEALTVRERLRGNWTEGINASERVLPVRFAGNRVVVLIHQVAGHVAHIRTDAQNILTGNTRREIEGE